jgi:hypothetical protein
VNNISITRNDAGNTASGVIGAVRISEVYTALAGGKPRQCGAGKFRARAEWRGGDGLSISLDDDRGVWFDFVTGEGGGVLDLVQLVRGGTRQEALRWVADLAGLPLADNQLSPTDRAEWIKKRQDLERDLPDARRWQRASVNMTEDLLTTLKAALFDPTLPQPDTFEIYDVEQMLARLRRLDGAELVTDYRWWVEHYPGMTAASVRAARERERTERRILLEYLRATNSDPERHAA